MSTPIAQYKIPSRIEIGFNSEAKAAMVDLKTKLDAMTRALSVKNDSHGDRLLAARQAEAANDAPVTYSPWENDLKRATVNDVDYLSGSDLDECVPHIDDVLDQPNWLSESAPQITQADMQLIFIKNLSETLIQRMHSMNRFSEDDYHIGNDKLMLWDIVKTDEVDEEFGVVVAKAEYEFKKENRSRASIVGFRKFCNGYHNTAHTLSYSLMPTAQLICTITEAELPAFRAALEACYA